MTIDRYSGDPKVYVDGHGAYLKWVGGQPIMDSGIENIPTLGLLIKKGWAGNVFIRDNNEHFGSDFVDACEKPISISMLNNARSVGERHLKKKMVDSGLARDVELQTSSPQLNAVKTVVTVTRSDGEEDQLEFEKYGPNWLQQNENPAGEQQ